MPQVPQIPLWIWFRPAALPSGLHVTLPPPLVAAFPMFMPFSLAELLAHVQLTPPVAQAVSIYGSPWHPLGIHDPGLFSALASPAPGFRPDLFVLVAESAVVSAPSPQLPFFGSPGVEALEFVDENDVLFDENSPDDLSDGLMVQRIEAAWKSAIQIERQLTGLRQKLSSIQASLGKMDRDLSSDERTASDREDRDEWNDVRRWLRDLQGKCHREIKAFDIGMTSGAGIRNSLEQRFSEAMDGQVAQSDLPVLRREFEKYRKDMVTLQRAMTATLQSASQNGTQRAQRVLGKIAGKIREMRAKNREPIGGANMDKTCRRKR